MSVQVVHTFGRTAFQKEGRLSARPQGGDELEVFIRDSKVIVHAIE